MATPLERELLRKMMVGEQLVEDDLRRLIRIPRETNYVDFKDGSTMASRGASDVVGQYVTGFANADGGLLLIGISNGEPKDRRFTNADRPGGQDLVSWATNVLGPIGGQFSPPPRMQAIVMDGYELLIIATTRAPILIPWDGDYFLRVGDSTRAVPPYLMSDLLLGRRAHPTLELRHLTGGCVGGGQQAERMFVFEVENVGMYPAERIVMGMVSWALKPRHQKDGKVAPDHLLSFVELVGVPAAESGELLVPIHQSSAAVPIGRLPAFERTRAEPLRLLATPEQAQVDVRAAIYIIAEGHPPEWYQFDWPLPPTTAAAEPATGSLTQCRLNRPLVQWGTFADGTWRREG